MSQLLKQALTTKAARNSSQLQALAVATATQFDPWTAQS